jgi:hypothetical protein
MLRDILDKTAQHVSHDLVDQPEAEAELCHTLAAVYGELREPEKAEKLSRRALEDWQKVFGAKHPALAKGAGPVVQISS